MEALVRDRVVGAIGVSNFEAPHLAGLPSDGAAIAPAMNQVEWNVCQHNDALAAACRARGVALCGYCPLGKGACLGHPVVRAVADRRRTSPAAVLLHWSLASGAVTIPKSRDPAHIRDNVAAGLGPPLLDDADYADLNALHSGLRATWDPSWVP